MKNMNFARNLLAQPTIYDTWQSLIGARACHKRFVDEMMCPIPGERILDIGCGVGASLRYLPDSIRYVGIDISEAYIRKAKDDFGPRGEFICADVTSVDAATLGEFDRAFSFGVLHHLSDEMVARLVPFIRRVLKPGGAFVTIDPCYAPGQHFIAKWLIDNDRGEHVRDAAGFTRALSSLGGVHAEVYQCLLRVPYTQIVMWVKVGIDKDSLKTR